MGQAEDEIRVDAEDALGAIPGLDVRRMFGGWGFYQRGLLFAAEGRAGRPPWRTPPPASEVDPDLGVGALQS